MEGLILRSQSGVFMAIMVVFMVALMSGLGVEGAEIHYVGGNKNSWAEGVNFSDWSSHQNIHLGDWLYFGYNKRQYNVLEVNETSYEKCIDQGFINNITRGGGRDVVQLNELKTYYFLSGGGYCFHGMRVAVSVQYLPPAPAPSPVHDASLAPISVRHITTTLVLIMLLICSFV